VKVIGALPAQPPLVAVRVCPWTAEPETTGSDVLEGAAVDVTTAVAAEVACTVPSLFEAVTATRSVLPTSPRATTYLEPLSPVTAPHAPPLASQRTH
jgi:hypothetical protein